MFKLIARKSAGISLIEMLLSVGMIAIMALGVVVMLDNMKNNEAMKKTYELSSISVTDRVHARFYKVKKVNELNLPISEDLTKQLLENVMVNVVVGDDYGLKMSKDSIINRNHSYTLYTIKYSIPKDLVNNEQFKKGYRENLAKSLVIMNKDNIEDVDFKMFNENQKDFSNLLKELKLENTAIKDVTPQDVDYKMVFNL